MARDARRTARPGAGPGRKQRPRPASRPATSSRQASVQSTPEPAGLPVPRFAQGVRLTNRALVLIVVIALLIVSWARSITIYYGLQQDLAAKHRDIAAKTADIASLEDQIKRWQDPHYVKAQARDRLGWVVPGETGYVVLGPDGKPIAGSAAVSDGRVQATTTETVWWQKVGDSLVLADQPVAAPATGPLPTPTRTTR